MTSDTHLKEEIGKKHIDCPTIVEKAYSKESSLKRVKNRQMMSI